MRWLEQFEIDPEGLISWVEVHVSELYAAVDLNVRLQLLVASYPLEVLKVLSKGTKGRDKCVEHHGSVFTSVVLNKSFT